MTATTKKGTKRRTGKKQAYPPLPPSASVVDIGGREYIITPLDEYDEWREDYALSIIATERMEREESRAVPFEAIIKSQERKRAKKGK